MVSEECDVSACTLGGMIYVMGHYYGDQGDEEGRLRVHKFDAQRFLKLKLKNPEEESKADSEPEWTVLDFIDCSVKPRTFYVIVPLNNE